MSSSFYRKPSEQQRLREFNVGDPEDMPVEKTVQMPAMQANVGYELSAAEREELQRMRQVVAKEPKLGDYAKKRIEILANIGRLTKDVEIEGIRFSLRTLKAKETREATMSIFKCVNDADAAYEIRRQTLARAIYQIDGQDIESTLGGNDFDLKLNLIDEMEDTIINKLYNEFNNLKQEVRTKFGLETEEQVKGVVEDIKK